MPEDSLSGVTVAVLAGGLGTRLRPVIGDRPKLLADVGGRPFAALLLDQIARFGFREVVLCVGHLADQIQSALGAEHGPLRIRHSREDVPLGTGGALRLALPFLVSEEVMVMNGDSYCDVDLRDVWSWHRARKAEASMVVVEVPDASRYGLVELDEAGMVQRFSEKQDCRQAGWINAGIYLTTRRRIQALPEGPLSLEREVLPDWVERGMWGYRTRGRFLDVGTPQSYADAFEFFSGGPGAES
jgi:NDP-sugar pyrophosphorylase family protein